MNKPYRPTNKAYNQAEKILKNKKTISVDYGNGTNEKYTIGEVNNMPEGKIDLIHAISNYVYWQFRGWKVKVE